MLSWSTTPAAPGRPRESASACYSRKGLGKARLGSLKVSTPVAPSRGGTRTDNRHAHRQPLVCKLLFNRAAVQPLCEQVLSLHCRSPCMHKGQHDSHQATPMGREEQTGNNRKESRWQNFVTISAVRHYSRLALCYAALQQPPLQPRPVDLAIRSAQIPTTQASSAQQYPCHTGDHYLPTLPILALRRRCPAQQHTT